MRRKESQARTRQRILDAASTLFQEQGLAATTLEQVGQAAGGYSKGAVYSNFASKSDLVFAIVEDQYAELTEALRRSLDAATDAASQVGVVLNWYRQLVRVESTWARALPELVFATQRDDEARRRVRGLLRSMRGTIAELLARQEEQLHVRFVLPPTTIAELGMALVGGLAMRAFLERDARGDDLFAAGIAALLQTAPAAGDDEADASTDDSTPEG